MKVNIARNYDARKVGQPFKTTAAYRRDLSPKSRMRSEAAARLTGADSMPTSSDPNALPATEFWGQPIYFAPDQYGLAKRRELERRVGARTVK